MQIFHPHTASLSAPKRDWTFLYVLDGDNDLREAATMDLVELNGAGAPDNTAVVAQLYRGDLKWNVANFRKKVDSLFKPSLPSAVAQDWRGMRVYEVRPEQSGGGTREMDYASDPKASPADPEELKNIVAWTMKKYPSKHFALVLSGHGSQEGLLSDSSGRKMPFPEVSSALKEASGETGRGVDVVLFDSCSTAGPQAQQAMRGATKFLLASPTPIRAGGWSEKATMDFLKAHPKATPEQLAQSLTSSQHSAVDSPVLYDLR